MKRNVSGRVIMVSASAVFCTGLGGTVTGCESSQIRSILGSETAMDLLSPLVKDAANAYIDDLVSLTGLLSNINSLQGVMDFVQMIQPTIEQLTSAYQTLSNTTGEEREWLLEAFGPKFSSTNAGFLDQSKNVTGNWSWNQILSQKLDQIQLFE
jgi:hypothetical protein